MFFYTFVLQCFVDQIFRWFFFVLTTNYVTVSTNIKKETIMLFLITINMRQDV